MSRRTARRKSRGLRAKPSNFIAVKRMAGFAALYPPYRAEQFCSLCAFAHAAYRFSLVEVRARELKFSQRNQARWRVQVLHRKIFRLLFSENRYFLSVVPPRCRGRFATVTIREAGMRWT
jgi:hypothetical protein